MLVVDAYTPRAATDVADTSPGRDSVPPLPAPTTLTFYASLPKLVTSTLGSSSLLTQRPPSLHRTRANTLWAKPTGPRFTLIAELDPRRASRHRGQRGPRLGVPARRALSTSAIEVEDGVLDREGQAGFVATRILSLTGTLRPGSDRAFHGVVQSLYRDPGASCDRR